MRKILILMPLVLLAVAGATTQPESIDSLKEQAAKATGKQQAELDVKIAEHQVRALDADYNSGNVERAQVALKDVVEYSQRAATAASDSGKHLKQTEVAMRKMAEKLQDIQKTLSVDDRPPVKEAVEKLQKLREELLARMFKR